MMLVDTNVLIDIVEDDPKWAEWSLEQLRSQSQVHELAINPIIYAELSVAFSHLETLDKVIDRLGLKFLEIPRAALFLAGKAFVKYRHAGGAKSSVLPDFFVGAHAAIASISLLTRDPSRYRTYFPGVGLVTP
jgi:predicted nucleic acid-binding protein